MTQQIHPICPECNTELEPVGNITYSDHKDGYITKGKVRCPECDFEGTISVDACVIFKEA